MLLFTPVITILIATTSSQLALGHGLADQTSDKDTVSRWKAGYSFTGVQTFAHLPHAQCLVEQDKPFDLAVIGVPFDTSVAYRTGGQSRILLCLVGEAPHADCCTDRSEIRPESNTISKPKANALKGI